MTRLARRIRKARLSTGMSQRELAIRLGVTRGAVANWESANATLPATERLQRIANTTGVAFEWLATGRGAAGYQASPDEVPAADMEIVDDSLELRLLRIFRAAPLRRHASIIAMLEAVYITAY
jgi:transcriptional regulator with XRE-family HTH domain